MKVSSQSDFFFNFQNHRGNVYNDLWKFHRNRMNGVCSYTGHTQWERERERETDRHRFLYIYIYIYRVCQNSPYRLWGLVVETKTIKFSIGTRVRNRTVFPLHAKSPHTLFSASLTGIVLTRVVHKSFLDHLLSHSTTRLFTCSIQLSLWSAQRRLYLLLCLS